MADSDCGWAEHKLLSDVVNMSSKRMIRFLAAEDTSSLQEQLSKLLTDLQGLEAIPREVRSGVCSRGRKLASLMGAAISDEDDSFRSPVLAAALINGLYAFKNDPAVQQVLLEANKRRAINLHTLSSVESKLEELSRYKRAATLLLQTRLKYSVLKEVEVIPVTLKRSDLPRAAAGCPVTDGDVMISRIADRLGMQKPKLEAAADLQSAGRKLDLSLAMKRALEQSKIHAEIQVALHWDNHAAEVRHMPRAVAVTKKPCFFCYEFLRLHGQLSTTSCSGKLYPEWNLPIWPTRQDMPRQFNQVLVNHTKQILCARMPPPAPKRSLGALHRFWAGFMRILRGPP